MPPASAPISLSTAERVPRYWADEIRVGPSIDHQDQGIMRPVRPMVESRNAVAPVLAMARKSIPVVVEIGGRFAKRATRHDLTNQPLFA